jgi:hypothetical protein
MNLQSISNKRIVDGKVVITEPYIIFKENQDVILEHIVDYDELGRPDLISLKYYNTHEFTDLILKFNGISNPFAIEVGKILEIPLVSENYVKFIKPSRNSEQTKKDKFVKERRMTNKDVKRLEFLQSISERGALPPNRLKDKEVNKVVKPEFTDLNGSLPTEQFRGE